MKINISALDYYVIKFKNFYQYLINEKGEEVDYEKKGGKE